MQNFALNHVTWTILLHLLVTQLIMKHTPFFSLETSLLELEQHQLFTSFIDDIVRPKHVLMHLGVFYSMAIFGPAIGYGLVGAFLSIYVGTWESTTLEQADPGWVGAWWLCFLFGGIVSILLSIPFLMFPRQLRNSCLVKEERKAEMARKYSSKYGEEKKFVEQIRTFPAHMKKLCQSPSWVLITIAISVLFFSLDGMIAFGPKYIESEFGVTASQASLTLGSLGKLYCSCTMETNIDNKKSLTHFWHIYYINWLIVSNIQYVGEMVLYHRFNCQCCESGLQDYHCYIYMYIFCFVYLQIVPQDTQIVLKHSAIDFNFVTNLWLFVPDFL